MDANRGSLWWTLGALLLFGASFGFVEASVVVYLREIYEPLATNLDPQRVPGDLFPLLTLEQLQAAGGPYLRLLATEVAREAATLVMLVAVGMAMGRGVNRFLAGFVVAFGLWDIFYYVFLKILIDWPSSLLEWDLLFLIPLPWVGPVVAPVMVAITMILAGAAVLWRESTDRPVHAGRWNWATMTVGGLVIVASFCWDYQSVAAGARPAPFPWPLFLAGEAIGVAGFLRALVRQP